MSKVYMIQNGELYHAELRNGSDWKKGGKARRRSNVDSRATTYRINYPDGYYATYKSSTGDIYGVYSVYNPNGKLISGVTTSFKRGSLEAMGLANELKRNGVVTYPFNFK